MHFVILDTKDGSRERYASELSKSLKKIYPDTEDDPLGQVLAGAAATPSILAEGELPVPNAQQAAQVQALKAEAQEYLKTAGSLIPGESIEAERFSLLAAPFGSYPKGTAVLVRRTSLAEICYLFPTVTVVPGGIRVMPPTPPATSQPAPSGPVPPTLIDAAKKLAEMLGSAILAELFPEKMPPYFSEVFEKIRGIVHGELTRQTVDELAGQFEGVIRFVKSEYEPEKAKSGVSPNLLRRLQHQSDEMYKMVATLMPDRYAMSGLAVFEFGAMAHMSMLQEIAIQRNKLGLLGEAPSAKTFADYAQHVEDTWPKVRDARNNGSVLKGSNCSAAGGGDIACADYYYWRDNVTGGQDGFYTWGCGGSYKDAAAAKAAAQNALNAHLAAAVEELKVSLSDPEALAKSWREAGKKLPG